MKSLKKGRAPEDEHESVVTIWKSFLEKNVRQRVVRTRTFQLGRTRTKALCQEGKTEKKETAAEGGR